MILRAILVAVALLAGCTHAQPPGALDRSGFVDVTTVVPDIVVDMRYYGTENFVGRRINGYGAPVCLLTKEAAVALRDAQMALRSFNFGLKVLDCYRPSRAVADFAAWARDPSDQKRKADFYPNVDKARLFELGYIAERSGHSRGSTVDVTLVRLSSKEDVLIGDYDLFDTSSWSEDKTGETPENNSVRPTARLNRMWLSDAMIAAGFRPLKEEWWHFTLNQEPFPETYFDFVVR